MTELAQNYFNEPLILGMGFFDCVHMGHRKLIGQIKNTAFKTNSKSAILTFSNNPYKLFNRDSKLIYTYKERLSVFEALGLDYCIPFKFDKAFKNISREDFLNNIFELYNIKGLVCGYDYLFGKDGKGDCSYLQEVCKTRNISLEIVEQLQHKGQRVSSTAIKQLLEKGDIESANEFLTTNYFMTGVVERGRGVGRLLEFPTANLSISKDKLLAKFGAYATFTVIDGKIYKSATNIGSKPTFKEPKITVETFISNFNGDLYGKEITVEFVKYLREIKKFSNSTELHKQILSDLNWEAN